MERVGPGSSAVLHVLNWDRCLQNQSAPMFALGAIHVSVHSVVPQQILWQISALDLKIQYQHSHTHRGSALPMGDTSDIPHSTTKGTLNIYAAVTP